MLILRPGPGACQVVLTTIEPHTSSTGTFDAYEYVVHSHQYITEDIPAARFSYELSPIQVCMQQRQCSGSPYPGCPQGRV